MKKTSTTNISTILKKASAAREEERGTSNERLFISTLAISPVLKGPRTLKPYPTKYGMRNLTNLRSGDEGLIRI